MKKLILIIAFALAYNASAQLSDDSTFGVSYINKPLKVQIKNNTHGNQNPNNLDKEIDTALISEITLLLCQHDTVPSHLLISTTEDNEYPKYSFWDNQQKYEGNTNITYSGYEVFKKIPQMDDEDLLIHIAYLDADKKPFPKSIIVWQSVLK